MNIGTRLLLSAALAVGTTIGAAALGQNAVRDAQAEIASAPTGASGGVGTVLDATTTTQREATGQRGATAQQETAAEREAAVRSELLAAAEAGEISWAAAERVGDDLGSYIRGDRHADVV